MDINQDNLVVELQANTGPSERTMPMPTHRKNRVIRVKKPLSPTDRSKFVDRLIFVNDSKIKPKKSSVSNRKKYTKKHELIVETTNSYLKMIGKNKKAPPSNTNST